MKKNKKIEGTKKPPCKYCGELCDADKDVIVVRLVSGETWHQRCER